MTTTTITMMVLILIGGTNATISYFSDGLKAGIRPTLLGCSQVLAASARYPPSSFSIVLAALLLPLTHDAPLAPPPHKFAFVFFRLRRTARAPVFFLFLSLLRPCFASAPPPLLG
ncbi:hypothetical protein RIF29_16007 [Crotalaria pallida]|uniref:Secreted protein n=1 Tax=Crotalaria pallida TaxID=3830 RepID=A0AAN9FI33_CROPI